MLSVCVYCTLSVDRACVPSTALAIELLASTASAGAPVARIGPTTAFRVEITSAFAFYAVYSAIVAISRRLAVFVHCFFDNARLFIILVGNHTIIALALVINLCICIIRIVVSRHCTKVKIFAQFFYTAFVIQQ